MRCPWSAWGETRNQCCASDHPTSGGPNSQRRWPATLEAAGLLESAGVLYAPGKASNAGGVATSGLEMSQNALRLAWPRAEVDARLLQIMQSIHAACLQHGRRADGSVSYIDGANIAGFVRVADAMLAQGVT